MMYVGLQDLFFYDQWQACHAYLEREQINNYNSIRQVVQRK